MSISEKIIDKIKSSETKQSEQELMIQILQIEDKGTYRYQTEYESIIKKYIDKHEEDFE